jgi:uncharacterized protein (TIGR03083 family)
MTTLADRTIDADHRTYERLARLVGTLDDDQLTQPSGASEWTVAQVLSHLGSGAEITLGTLRAAQSGTEPAADANQVVWARWDAMRPREQADGYLRAGRELDRALAELAPAQRTGLRVPMGFLPQPASIELFSGMRLNEVALHAWDVEVAVDPAATLPGDVATVLVDQYLGPLGFLLGFTAKPDQLSDRPVTLTVRATAPDRTFGLGLAEQVQLTEAPGESDGELELPLETFPRLLTGRLRARDLSGGVRVRGPISLDDLRRVFPGF